MKTVWWHSRVVIILIVAVLLVVAMSAIALVSQSDSEQAQPEPSVSVSSIPAAPSASTSVTPAPPMGQRTLLLQVMDGQSAAVADVLIATGGQVNGGSQLYLSPITLVPVPMPTPLQATTTSSDTLQAKNGVSMLLGVRVDAAVALNRLALAALVDSVGGVPIAVPFAIEVTDDKGTIIKTVQPGARTLDGVTATTYALTLQPGESQSVRIKRFGEVLSRILPALPADVESMRQLVLSLGSLAKSTATNDELVEILLAVQQEAVAGTMTVSVLPTTTLISDRASVMQRSRGLALVATLMPEALLGPGQSASPRIELVRAGASLAEVLRVTDALVAAGFTVVDAGRAPNGESRIVIPDASPEAVSVGAEAATALGMAPNTIRIHGGTGSPGAVRVLVGNDLPSL